MSFFKLRKTKMLDEAVLNHKPQSIITMLLVFYLVYIIGQFISSVIVTIPSAIWMVTYDGFIDMVKSYTEAIMAGNEDTAIFEDFINNMVLNQPSWLNLVSLLATAGVGASAIFYCIKFEKRPLTSLGIRKKDVVKEYLLGAIIGAVMLGLTFLISFLFDSVSIKLNPNGFSLMVILFLIGFMVQGFAEEVLFRGYFMMSIARDYKIAVAIGFTSVLFGLLHGANTGFNLLALVNIILFGIFTGVYVFKRGDLWGVSAIHTMWNFMQGCIIGSNVSGVANIPSIFVLEIKENMSLANGGSFGLEASMSTTIVLLIAISLVFLLKTKKGEESLSDAIDFE